MRWTTPLVMNYYCCSVKHGIHARIHKTPWRGGVLLRIHLYDIQGNSSNRKKKISEYFDKRAVAVFVNNRPLDRLVINGAINYFLLRLKWKISILERKINSYARLAH